MSYQAIHFDRLRKQIHLWDDSAGYNVYPFKKYAFQYNENGSYTSMYGEPLIKIHSWDETTPNLYESDVPEVTRFLVDTYTNDDASSTGHRVLTYDIEISMENGMPDVMNPKSEITSIALHDKVTDEYYVYILDEDYKLDRYSEPYNDSIVFVEPVGSERDLLSSFLDKYQEISPTIVTGWNIDAFDTPYLVNRISQVLSQSEARRLSPIGEVYYNKYKQRYQIAGVSYLDYMLLYKNFTYTELPTYRLDYVGKKEIDKGKIEYEGSLDDLFSIDKHKFIEYNLVDVEIVVKLEDKLQFIELARGICHAGHVAYEDFRWSSKFLEGAVLTLMKRKGVVAVNKKYRGKLAENELGFEGAYVKEPIPGRYEWVYDLDLTSLYPSIIMSLNISPETKLGKVGNWNIKDYMKGISKVYLIGNEQYTTEQLKDFLNDNHVSISSNGILYNLSEKGIIPEILELWFSQRFEMKQKRDSYNEGTSDYSFYDRNQHIQKILLNSMYGVLGLPIFRFYDIDNAEAVTLVGQDVIKTTAKIANIYYNNEIKKDNDYVIYTDTDSTFLSALPLIEKRYPNIKESEMVNATLEVASEVQEHINNSYDFMSKKMFNLDNHRFEIKQETVSKSAVWIKKKRYAQWIINKEGKSVDKLDIKGLDVVRSSFPKSFQVFMKEILLKILKNHPKSEIDELILDFKNKMNSFEYGDVAKVSAVKDITKWKRNNEYTLFEYKKGTPAHVKASLSFNDMLKYYKLGNKYSPIKNGEKIKWVYLKKNSLGLDGLAFRDFEDPKEVLDYIKQYVNYDRIYEAELKSKLVDFYKALKWDFPSESLKNMGQFFDV